MARARNGRWARLYFWGVCDRNYVAVTYWRRARRGGGLVQLGVSKASREGLVPR